MDNPKRKKYHEHGNRYTEEEQIQFVIDICTTNATTSKSLQTICKELKVGYSSFHRWLNKYDEPDRPLKKLYQESKSKKPRRSYMNLVLKNPDGLLEGDVQIFKSICEMWAACDYKTLKETIESGSKKIGHPKSTTWFYKLVKNHPEQLQPLIDKSNELRKKVSSTVLKTLQTEIMEGAIESLSDMVRKYKTKKVTRITGRELDRKGNLVDIDKTTVTVEENMPSVPALKLALQLNGYVPEQTININKESRVIKEIDPIEIDKLREELLEDLKKEGLTETEYAEIDD